MSVYRDQEKYIFIIILVYQEANQTAEADIHYLLLGYLLDPQLYRQMIADADFRTASLETEAG